MKSEEYVASAAVALPYPPHGVIIDLIASFKINAAGLQIVRPNERPAILDEFVRERPLFTVIAVFNQQNAGCL